MGATQASPPDWSVAGGSNPIPFCGAFGNYTIAAGIECRNILIQAYTGSSILQGFVGAGINGTFTDFYVHALFEDCAYPNPPAQTGTSCPSTTTEAQGMVSAGNTNEEISYGTIENGDAFFLGAQNNFPTNVNGICPGVNYPCEYGMRGIQTTGAVGGPVEIQHVNIYGGVWDVRLVGTNASGSNPYLVHDSDFWGTMFGVNPSLHINRREDALQTATLISYNNLDHDHVSGSGNLLNCPAGLTYYFFNEAIWGVGTSSPPYGFDNRTMGSGGNGGGCVAHVWNDTLNDAGTSNSPYNTVNINAATVATSTLDLQNLHNMTGPSVVNPFWGCNTMVNCQDYAGSLVVANVQAASVVDSTSSATSQGYVLGTLFGPASGCTSSTCDTLGFANGSTTVNLSSLCTGYLAALCSDINGKPRPGGSVGWQAGAYVYGTAPPAGNCTDNLTTTASLAAQAQHKAAMNELLTLVDQLAAQHPFGNISETQTTTPNVTVNAEHFEALVETVIATSQIIASSSSACTPGGLPPVACPGICITHPPS